MPAVNKPIAVDAKHAAASRTPRMSYLPILLLGVETDKDAVPAQLQKTAADRDKFRI
jgi:hypothetical protein